MSRPHFRQHVVGRNLLPLFREHDRQRFEISCYADAPRPDELTHQFRSYADAWRSTTGLSDAQLAQRVREDRIDILVDLTLHMAHNRLLVFARKPAPVQVTFAGYPGTTGLSTIDYRITDPYLDPPGLYDACYAEESVRLPDSFWCYDPLDSEAGSQRPARGGEGVRLVRVPQQLLQGEPARPQDVGAGPEGRRSLAADDPGRRRVASPAALDLLAAEGVGHDRVTFVAQQPRQQYLRYYHGIDVGLDTVPYNGHTTSLDSFWMGVPVVTLVGQTVVGRAGLCQLTNLGLPELIATDPEQFVRIAVGVGARSAPAGQAARDPACPDAGFAFDGRSALRPQHGGRLP